MSRVPLLLLSLCAPLLAGCPDSADIDPMELQQRYKPYAPSDFFADGRSMRPPPDGAIPRDHVVGEPAFTTGLVGGKPVEKIPVPLSIELLELGRKRFDITCAACHGLLGDGNSVVAAQMALRPPASLLSPRIRTMPVGTIFETISEGYGVMPGYAAEVPIRERWATIAYLRALELSQDAPVDAVPNDVKDRLQQEAR
jgi:mono/diheme cytochrome c family protein